MAHAIELRGLTRWYGKRRGVVGLDVTVEDIVAQVQVDLAWLGDFGAFKYIVTTELIDAGVVPWTSVVVFGVTAVAGWAASLVVFARRDLLA